MTESVPATAPGGPPLIGDSTVTIDFAANAVVISFASGEPVVHRLT